MANGPFPPVDPNALGDVFCLSVDRLLVPYLLGVVDDLTTPGAYDGDIEDVIGTVYAFEDLIQRLTLETSCMVGQVIMLATAEIPVNCLPCDGTTYNRVDYPALYAVLHASLKLTADTFKTPDLRDRYPYAAGTAFTAHQTGGEAEHTLDLTEVPAHSHALTASTILAKASGTAGTSNRLLRGTDANTNSNVLNQLAITLDTQGGGEAHNNLPPLYALPFAIVAR